MTSIRSPGAQAGIEPARGVGEQDGAAAEPGEQAHAEDDPLRLVPLVEVDAPLEARHRTRSPARPRQRLPACPTHRRARPCGGPRRTGSGSTSPSPSAQAPRPEPRTTPTAGLAGARRRPRTAHGGGLVELLDHAHARGPIPRPRAIRSRMPRGRNIRWCEARGLVLASPPLSAGGETSMATKIEDFLKEKKIDPRRVLVASAEIERLRLEDRSIRLAKRAARKSEDPAKKKEGLAAKKPRSGRPVTQEAHRRRLRRQEHQRAAEDAHPARAQPRARAEEAGQDRARGPLRAHPPARKKVEADRVGRSARGSHGRPPLLPRRTASAPPSCGGVSRRAWRGRAVPLPGGEVEQVGGHEREEQSGGDEEHAPTLAQKIVQEQIWCDTSRQARL